MSSVVDGILLRLGVDPASLQAGLRKASASLDTFGGRAGAVMGRVNAALKTSADRALTPMTGLLLGGGVAVAASQFGNFSEELMYYGMVAKKSKEGISALRSEIHGLAKQTGIDQQVILGGINKIAEITGDTQFAEGMAGMLAKTSKATKADLADLATVASTMRVQWGWNEQAIAEAFNTLIVQGDQGSYTLQALAGEGKALLSSANAFGIKTKSQFESFGAFLQVMNASIKSEAEVTTSMSSLMNELISKSKDLGKLGVRIFDMKDGKAQVRDFETIMMELMKATNADISVISPMFGDEAKKALKPLMEEYQRGWTNYRKIRDSALGSGTSEIDSRFATTANDFNTNIGKMKAASLEFADTNLAGPVERLTQAMRFLSDHQGVFSAALYSIAAAAGVLAAVKLGGKIKEFGSFASELKGLAKGRVPGSDGVGGLAGQLTGAGAVQQVYVTNWHMMGQTQGMTSYIDPSRNAAGMKDFSNETARSTGRLGRFGSAMGKFARSDLGMGALSMATAWAVGKITEAGNLIYDWWKSKNDAEQTTENMLAANRKPMEKRGADVVYWSDQIDAAMLEKQEISNSFGNNFFGIGDGRIKVLDENIGLYTRLMKEANARRVVQEAQKTGIKAPDQTIQIFVDAEKRRAVVESSGGYEGPNKLRVNTMPWAGSPMQ